ncbi:uncharacterized protein LOC132729571 [Ruditapes philippinarum]|uniref:uncharacterized protein LOC132729571 n=1 Tax=Ruditapes philippinarum TaxID=129788 RepID=UPI00295ACEB0|nr:uncharacterized protein LOC132729571 [Ruditapes philippinarum]
MADHFHRLFSFLVNICPDPLRKLFLVKAKADPGAKDTLLDSFLRSKENEIRKLKLHENQYALLFPLTGKADAMEWDIALLTVLINKLFSCSPQITFYINQIREIRNKLLHLPNTSSIDDTDFEDCWNALETATLVLADLQGLEYKETIKGKIDKARIDNLPDLGNTLCKWFEGKFTEMQRDTKDIKENVSESVNILRSTTVTTTEADGKEVKSFKILNEELKGMHELTELFLEHSQGYVDPEMLKAAKTKMEENKSVIIIGNPASGKTSLAVALAASYERSKVLLLTSPDQVQHVNYNKTHLVIIEDFAGKYNFDKVQACNWYRKLDLLKLMTSAGKLNLIVTCDKEQLKMCMDKIAIHLLFEHRVDLQPPNGKHNSKLLLPWQQKLKESMTLKRVSDEDMDDTIFVKRRESLPVDLICTTRVIEPTETANTCTIPFRRGG